MCQRHLAQLRIDHGRARQHALFVGSGQQLMFAHMHNLGRVPRPPVPAQRLVWPERPLRYQQLVMFDITPNLRPGRAVAPAPVDVVLAAALDEHVSHVSVRDHWTWTYTSQVRAAVRIVLGLQHTPGAAITATEIKVLAQLRLPARTVRDLLAEVGMLDDDRTPAIRLWFEERTRHLTPPMRTELSVWFDIMTNGSTITPRRKPRNQGTCGLYLRWALPTLTDWNTAGHDSLREISRTDVLAALPPGGLDRAQTGQALRSIFNILKARKLVFVNPADRIPTWTSSEQIPLPANLDVIARTLDTSNPTRAAIAALSVFHGVRSAQIRRLHLTDIRDRRIHIEDRSIPLAEGAYTRIVAYLAHRQQHYPDSINPHLFINRRTTHRLEPVGPRWLRLAVDLPGGLGALRQDRILDEAIASNGDTRRLCDLFGLSISAATRYTNTISHPDLQ